MSNYDARGVGIPFKRVNNFSLAYGDRTNPFIKTKIEDCDAVVLNNGEVHFLSGERLIEKDIGMTDPVEWTRQYPMVVNASGLPLLDANGNQRTTTLQEIQLQVLAFIRYHQLLKDNNTI